jgi:hypothetical protein
MRLGFVVSTTVTVKDALLVLPCESEAVQLTVVLPSGKVEPLVGLQLTGFGPSATSVAVGPV